MFINLFIKINNRLHYEWDFLMDSLKLRRNNKLKIMDSRETIAYILKNGCSVSRFGDGELSIILENGEIGFQRYDPLLSELLQKVLKNPKNNLLICLPLPINSVKGMTKKAKRFWNSWLLGGGNRKNLIETMLLENRGGYGNTQISRPYMDYKDKSRAGEIFSLLKLLWKDRDLLIVEGDQTKMGVGNSLFNGAKSIIRILAPATNAFAVYDRIKDEIQKYVGSRLVLLALGPTATVLSWDLASSGIQILDIGHIDVEYEWYLANAIEKNAIQGKYVNEAEGLDVLEQNCIGMEEYRTQIVETICS